jgi:uncharacterized protein YozE (UPF0346 family)
LSQLHEPPFTTWLLDQQSRRDTIGNLARFVAHDRCWPPVTNGFGVLSRHLIKRHRSDSATLDSRYVAWNEWRAATS